MTILILGGGLAGLSAAHRLAERLPSARRLILEREREAGGLCRSRRVGEFTFDYTGHFLHLRDPEMTGFVHDLLGDELIPVARRAFVFTRGVVLDFPFQANLHGLPAEVVARCLIDFIEADRRRTTAPGGPAVFETWSREVFGDGIAEEFLLPYNTKLFGVPAGEITSEWAHWSAPRPDLAQVVRGAVGLKNTGLGYNPRFLQPRRGGIGALAGALAARVEGDLRLGADVVAVDARRRTATLASGETLAWDRLISTAPLPRLLSLVSGLDDGAGSGRPTMAALGAALRWRAVIDLELGVDRPDVADGAHWMYFPDDADPFYRVGFPSNVDAARAPADCSSLSVEFSHPPGTPVPPTEHLIAAARPRLERANLLRASDRIVAADAVVLDPAYVIFDGRRTPLVAEALARLEQAGIQSIGRFGAWTYSAMEQALLDGRAAADRIVSAS